MATPNAGTKLDVVIVYAFDCTTTTPAWNKMDEVYWLVHQKLAHFANGSCLGYIYAMSTPNTYTCDMKVVDAGETAATGYTTSPLWNRTACEKNMASGLVEAHRLIRENKTIPLTEPSDPAVILFFSDGNIAKGDYFDATESFFSKLPVHTFTLAGDAHKLEDLQTVAANSIGGTFNTLPVPDEPKQSAAFSGLLDAILSNTISNGVEGKLPPSVFIVYAFDSTNKSTAAYRKVDEIFRMVHKNLTKIEDSSLGFIYPMLGKNQYMLDMKLVDPTDKNGSYKCSPAWGASTLTKNMASGLYLANKVITHNRRSNAIILFFSDGLVHNGDFFDGVESFVSGYPVYTFTLGVPENLEVLYTIGTNSPDGAFVADPVPDDPEQFPPFAMLLDSVIGTTTYELPPAL